ncbi:MAG TPA: DUF6325 family protein [Conexibacter sp.]|jgi:uncharacterized membrane protein|nr:DUF6325 family protein [Conexibacter sp.]
MTTERMDAMESGPMQLVVLGFAGGEMRGEVLAELDRLAEHDIVRLVDALLVRKHEDGSVELMEISQEVGGDVESGALVGALTGLIAEAEDGGAEAPTAAAQLEALEADVWYVADAIPPGTAAAVALLEHRWAIPLRTALQGAGGELLEEAWVHPLDLAAVGLDG